MRAVELPDGIEREIIVVDDGSNDGTRDVLRSSATAPCASSCTSTTAGRAPRCAPGSRTRPATTCSSRTPTSSTTPRTGRSCSRRCSAASARVVYGSRFTGERRNMLFLHWIGNRLLSLTTNVLYNTTLSDMETCYKLVDRELLDDLDLRVGPLRHRARDHRQDPEAGHPHLRGADLVHGPRVRRGQEDHVARRLRGVVDAREVPLP